MSQHRQIFQANSPLRWKSFKWTTRIFFFILFFVIAIVVVAVVRGKAPNLPNIESKDKLFENAMNLKDGFNLSSKDNKKYKGFKAFLDERQREDSLNKAKGKSTIAGNPYIRAAFYSPSTNPAVSLADLDAHASGINTIFPEWFFINLNDNSKIDSRIDSAGFAIMKKNNLRIIPMFTNFNSAKQDFDGGLVHAMLNDPAKRTRFINDLADTLTKYQLQGINVDFEDLQEKTADPLTNFQKELYEVFHAKGLLVTQDVVPDNDDYDFEKLNAYNDYIVLMAYDQHNDGGSGPGPVSGQKWIEEVLDKAASKMESKKIILGLAGFGYDWLLDAKGKPVIDEETGKSANPVTYSQAIDKAKQSGATVEFDNDNFNLHYEYTEDNNGEMITHVVWFTGAVTTYNIMRFSDEKPDLKKNKNTVH